LWFSHHCKRRQRVRYRKKNFFGQLFDLRAKLKQMSPHSLNKRRNSFCVLTWYTICQAFWKETCLCMRANGSFFECCKNAECVFISFVSTSESISCLIGMV
jgi:hypothetical protein